MVGTTGNILNAIQQGQLTVLQRTARKMDELQLRLATGRDVNSAIDNPNNFFTALALDNKALDLQRLLDGINQSIKTTELAQHGLAAMQDILDTAESFLLDYEEDFLAGEVQLTETQDDSVFLQFNNPTDFISYGGGQDSGAPISIIESGLGVRLDDNAWRRTAVNYNITADTVLEFDFLSSNIPEIAAIGFDNDTNFSNGNTQFFLYGTQTTGITYSAPTPTYQYDGSGDWVHVAIPVGTFFTGNFSHLTFIDDDDGGGDDGDAQFRNIVIHEGDYVYGQTALGVSSIYEENYSAILEQFDMIAKDSQYRGTNLLDGDDLTTYFNTSYTNSLSIEGLKGSSVQLGLERTGFTTIESVRDKITQVREARGTLRNYASSLATDFGILNHRYDYTTSEINTLKAGRDDLIVADQNRDGAEFLALQSRQLIQTSILTLSTASIADFLT